jgi:putative ABC transport system permease protein
MGYDTAPCSGSNQGHDNGIPIRTGETNHFLNKSELGKCDHRPAKPSSSMREGLAKVESVFNKYNPAAPFEYKFTDEEYARKFEDEKRIGNLSTFFAILAVFISCLGLFGLASFVAEQRTKEIGVRKVLGASVFNLWRMLSKDFVGLVIISCAIAIPVAWYFLHQWLLKYPYRTDISGWIFILAGVGAMAITLITVSYQAIKAAMMNPVTSLRSE